jgi:hypothetical protein
MRWDASRGTSTGGNPAVSTTFPPPEPGRHGIAELLALVGVIRRLASGPCRPSRHWAASATRSTTTMASPDPRITTPCWRGRPRGVSGPRQHGGGFTDRRADRADGAPTASVHHGRRPMNACAAKPVCAAGVSGTPNATGRAAARRGSSRRTGTGRCDARCGPRRTGTAAAGRRNPAPDPVAPRFPRRPPRCSLLAIMNGVSRWSLGRPAGRERCHVRHAAVGMHGQRLLSAAPRFVCRGNLTRVSTGP